MTFTHVDLTGLEHTPMRDAPIVTDRAHVRAMLNDPASSFAIAGMRHSQGGQTALENGRLLITEAFNGVRLPPSSPTDWVDVDAGAVWSAIHRRVAELRLSPRVQQSSAYFTVGGSLAVNCHGRELRWGTISQTVVDLEVLTGRGEVVAASPNHNAELFRATLGGFGATGLILRARLLLTPNYALTRHRQLLSLAKYASALNSMAAGNGPAGAQLHHAFINVSEHGYLDEALSVTAVAPAGAAAEPLQLDPDQLRAENLGSAELLSAGWAAARVDGRFRTHLWDQLKAGAEQEPSTRPRLDYLREDIMFTAGKANEDGVDLLQEYFVPIDKLGAFMNAMRARLPYAHDLSSVPVNLLSCTVRSVDGGEQDSSPYLSYCPPRQHRASVAIAVHVARGEKGGLNAKAVTIFQSLIEDALALGGSFYLPYHRFATLPQVRKAYPQIDAWMRVVSHYDPSRRFRSRFLQHYEL